MKDIIKERQYFNEKIALVYNIQAHILHILNTIDYANHTPEQLRSLIYRTVQDFDPVAVMYERPGLIGVRHE